MLVDTFAKAHDADQFMQAGLHTYQRMWRLRWQFAIGSILVIAALLRFARLGSVPLPLSDEVFGAVDVHSVLLTGNHFDGSKAGALAYIVVALDGRVIAFLANGASLLSLRVISATFGVATVALMIPLGIELGDLALGVVAAAALAVMPWDIYFSRIFYPTSEYVFLTFVALLFTLIALRKRSVIAALVATAAAVGALYIYPVSIVSTPLLVAAILVVQHDQFIRFGIRRMLGVVAIGSLLLVPYVINHLAVSDAGVAGQNTVITSALIWNHGLSLGDIVKGFIARWSSYQSARFTILSGDPIVRWSIQVMGSVGWVLGPIGWIGVAIAIGRRNAADQILLLWLVLYPVADALTFYDAEPNGVRGITGSVTWALLAATAVLALRQISSPQLKGALATLITVGIAVQAVAFTWIYFGPYNKTYAYAFETGYPSIYPILHDHQLESVPITLHAGYRRDIMLQYFSAYRLRSSEQILACYDLPLDVLLYTQLPRIFIVREDPDVQQQPGCIHRGLIQRDEAALSGVTTQLGQPSRRVDVIAIFPDDASGKYATAILYVHN
jgi:4-amino-4-deoxy-L-arabinose transferase-like glycosyltransferase